MVGGADGEAAVDVSVTDGIAATVGGVDGSVVRWPSAAGGGCAMVAKNACGEGREVGGGDWKGSERGGRGDGGATEESVLHKRSRGRMPC